MINVTKPIEIPYVCYDAHGREITYDFCIPVEIIAINPKYCYIKTFKRETNYNTQNWRIEAIYHLIHIESGHVIVPLFKGDIKKFLKTYTNITYRGDGVFEIRDGSYVSTITSKLKYEQEN
jgi:hypothetical protein